MVMMTVKKPMPWISRAFESFMDVNRLSLSLVSDGEAFDAQLQSRAGGGAYYFVNECACLYGGRGQDEKDAIIALIKQMRGKTIVFMGGDGLRPYKLRVPLFEV